jgi:hypothetical protein
MNTQTHKLIEEYFPDNREKAEAFISSLCYGIVSEIDKFSSTEYQKYTLSANNEFKGSSYILGLSDGADVCAEIVQNMLDGNKI